MSPVTSVIFDFGGVLVDWRPAQLLERLYPDPVRRERIRTTVLSHPDWIELDRGTLREADSLATFAARAGESVDEIAALMDAVRNSLLPKDDTITALSALHRLGIPLYALSNISEENYQAVLSRHPCFSWFRGTVISARVRMVKPDRDIYEHLCAAHGLEPASCLFIDDMPANIATAASMGFQTLLFRSATDLKAHLNRLGLTSE